MKTQQIDSIYWDSIRTLLKPVLPLIEDETVSEILINGSRNTYYEKNGNLHLSEILFEERTLKVLVRNLAQYVGRNLYETTHQLEARFPDGSRVQAVMPPISRSGICIAIRKFSRRLLSLKDLVEKGAITKNAASWLKIMVKMRKNIIISGGTSSGKTTLLNILGGLISEKNRIVVLEDSAELQIKHPDMVAMESRATTDEAKNKKVDIRELVRVSLRLRPDRIIVGEVRGAEALDMLQAMTTGHAGSMSTVHANDSRTALMRLETLSTYGTSGEIPLATIRSQVASTVEVIVQMNRFWDGSRNITSISEVMPLDINGEYKQKVLFKYRIRKRERDGKVHGSLQPTGEVSSFVDQLPFFGIELDKDFFQK